MSALPTMTPLESSMLKGMHYAPETRTLTVQFSNGKSYAYSDVTAERAAALEGSASPGRYFNDQVKGLHSGLEVFGDDK